MFSKLLTSKFADGKAGEVGVGSYSFHLRNYVEN